MSSLNEGEQSEDVVGNYYFFFIVNKSEIIIFFFVTLFSYLIKKQFLPIIDNSVT